MRKNEDSHILKYSLNPSGEKEAVVEVRFTWHYADKNRSTTKLAGQRSLGSLPPPFSFSVFSASGIFSADDSGSLCRKHFPIFFSYKDWTPSKGRWVRNIQVPYNFIDYLFFFLCAASKVGSFFFFLWFQSLPWSETVQGLLLAQHSGITPSMSWG